MHELGHHIGIVDLSFEQLELAKEELKFDFDPYLLYEEALKYNYDAVVICTPPHLHVQQAIQALSMNKNVLIEKPLSLDFSGIAQLEALATEKEKLVMVGLCFRYHEGLRKVKRLIESGLIGRLLYVRAELGEDLATARPNVDYRQLYVTAKNVGVSLDLIHEPDYVQWIIGSPIKSVTAMNRKVSELQMEGDDVSETIVEFINGTIASIHVDFFQKYRRRLSSYIGTEGTITLEMANWNISQISYFNSSTDQMVTETLEMQRDDMFREMDLEFINLLNHGGETDLNVKEAMKSLALVLAARKSSELGKSVDLNNMNEVQNEQR